jgi:hypothetical protein
MGGKLRFFGGRLAAFADPAFAAAPAEQAAPARKETPNAFASEAAAP